MIEKTERRKALEEAARVQCYLCAEGELSEYDDVTGRFYHRNDGSFYNAGFCRANNIRVLAEKN